MVFGNYLINKREPCAIFEDHISQNRQKILGLTFKWMFLITRKTVLNLKLMQIAFSAHFSIFRNCYVHVRLLRTFDTFVTCFGTWLIITIFIFHKIAEMNLTNYNTFDLLISHTWIILTFLSIARKSIFFLMATNNVIF